MKITLKQITDKYGLTPEGVDYALEQYGKLVFVLTGGRLSKLTYPADYLLTYIQDMWCEECELKEEKE